MDTKKNLKIHINLDIRILALVLLTVVGVLFWASARAGAQDQGGSDTLDTNNYADQQKVQPALTQPELKPQTVAPEPGMLPNTNLGWIKPEELGIGLNSQTQPNVMIANPTYPRHFYLTQQSYTPNQALTACAIGYHMASLWEILDVTSLIYDYDHPSATIMADSGWGPPSYWNGWVRTGWSSNNTNTAGTGNCKNWSSILSTDFGAAVRLSRTWESAPGDIFVWDATSFSCNFSGPVWCVKD